MTALEKKIAENTLNILQNNSWGSLSLEQALKNNKNKKVDIQSKFDLLKIINSYVDDELIKKTRYIENSSIKDMLFEVIMARFDILELNRKSFIEIYKCLKKNPKYFIKLLPSFLESMIITAELSNFNVNGLKGSIRLKGLVFLYFMTFFQWKEDNNSSLEKTMTALDKNLDHAEKLGKLVS